MKSSSTNPRLGLLGTSGANTNSGEEFIHGADIPRPRARRRTFLSAVLIGIGPVGPVAAAAEPLDYVALGDSSVSGTGVPIQESLLCTRSTKAWPKVVAAELGAELTDVSCGSAQVKDFSSRQWGVVPPQYDALTPDTDLVTLTIGGNDIGLVQTALSCLNLLPEPAGFSCKERYTAGAVDTISDAIAQWAPQLGAAVEEVRRRSPGAEIVVAGYGTYLREDGCHPVQPIWARDANYLQAKIDELSSAMREQTVAHGATFVDLAPVTVGHDVCAAPRDRYLEGLVPVAPAAPLHPNAKGLAAYGAEVQPPSTQRAPGPDPPSRRLLVRLQVRPSKIISTSNHHQPATAW